MKTKKFDYTKWGKRLIKDVAEYMRRENHGKRTPQFWDIFAKAVDWRKILNPEKLPVYDKFERHGQQWRRIYYEAKKREREGEKNRIEKGYIVEIIPSPNGDYFDAIYNPDSKTHQSKRGVFLLCTDLWNYIDKLQRNQCGLGLGKEKCPNVVERLNTAIEEDKQARIRNCHNCVNFTTSDVGVKSIVDCGICRKLSHHKFEGEHEKTGRKQYWTCAICGHDENLLNSLRCADCGFVIRGK